MTEKNKREMMIRDPFFEREFWPFDIFRDLDQGLNLLRNDPWDLAFRPIRVFRREGMPARETRFPRTDFKDKGNSYEIRAELPGISKENIEITLEEDAVEIKAKHEEKKEENDQNFFHKEIRSQAYQRRFTLPERVQLEKGGNFLHWDD